MKTIFFLFILLQAGLSFGQKPVTVECRTGAGVGSKINLFRVENGNKVAMANAVYNKNGYYGFSFIPEYEGFYVIGDDRNYQYPLYLKEGDAISLYMDADTVYLEGKKNTPENRTLYRWVDLSRDVAGKSVFFFRVHNSTYKDFFPEFETFLAAADQFQNTIKTGNPRFNELMKRTIGFEKDLYALTFLYTPRSAHPTKEQRLAYYTNLINPDKFRDDVILSMPYGMDLVRLYTMFARMESGQMPADLGNIAELIPDTRVQGEIVANRASGFKSYFEFKEFMNKNTVPLNADQKKRVEAAGSALYEMRKGQPAAEFSYPDANGKMVSLADFRGKVVLVDVWATWCGPCRGELPHLKKLEEEMKGTDVVFVGVSLDEEKNHDKWKKFLVDEQLPGVQLFADGWSKIAKDYKITGIPRFMVFDREGKVVEANSPRPSDPNLKKLLEEELKK